jgi:predicted PurR-regulated permease PerM
MSEPHLRPIYVLVAAASVFVIMFGIRETAFILNPILLAVVITIAVLPLPNNLTRRGMPGWLALLVTVLAVAAALGLIILLIVGGVSRLGLRLPEYAQNIAARSAEVAEWIENNVAGSAGNLTIDSGQVSTFVLGVARVVGSALAQVFMTFLIFIFMVSAAVSLPAVTRSGLQSGLPIMSRVSSFTADVRRYLNITTAINLLVAAGNTILLLVMGVDFAVLWGLLAWILGYIPSVGFWLALIPPAVLAWAEFGLTEALIVFAGYVLINGVVQNFLQPKLMGDELRISPVTVFLSLFVWGWLLGAIGAILAVPLTLILLAFLDSFESTHWVAALMRLSAGREDAAQLQARDQVRAIWERVRTLGVRPPAS